MFPASLGEQSLGMVWEALDEVAGSGSIVDNRLISKEAGIQFTSDFKGRLLPLDDLLKKMPDSRFEALGRDRLKIELPSPS